MKKTCLFFVFILFISINAVALSLKSDSIVRKQLICYSIGFSYSKSLIYLKNGFDTKDYFLSTLQPGFNARVGIIRKNFNYYADLNYDQFGYKSKSYDTLNWIGKDWDPAESPYQKSLNSFYKDDYKFLNLGIGLGYKFKLLRFRLEPAINIGLGSMINYVHTIYNLNDEIVYQYKNNKSTGSFGPVYPRLLFNLQGCLQFNFEYLFSKSLTFSISPKYIIVNKFSLYKYGISITINYYN